MGWTLVHEWTMCTTRSIYLPLGRLISFLFPSMSKPPTPKMVSSYNKMAIFSYFRHVRRRRRDAKVYSISSKVAEIQADTAVTRDIPLVPPGSDDVHLMIISTPSRLLLSEEEERGGETSFNREIETPNIHLALASPLFAPFAHPQSISDAWWTIFHYHYVRADNSICSIVHLSDLSSIRKPLLTADTIRRLGDFTATKSYARLIKTRSDRYAV